MKDGGDNWNVAKVDLVVPWYVLVQGIGPGSINNQAKHLEASVPSDACSPLAASEVVHEAYDLDLILNDIAS